LESIFELLCEDLNQSSDLRVTDLLQIVLVFLQILQHALDLLDIVKVLAPDFEVKSTVEGVDITTDFE
jgi:hypothetical protein